MKRREFMRNAMILVGSASCAFPNWNDTFNDSNRVMLKRLENREVDTFGNFDFGLRRM